LSNIDSGLYISINAKRAKETYSLSSLQGLILALFISFTPYTLVEMTKARARTYSSNGMSRGQLDEQREKNE